MDKGLCPSPWSAETCVHIHFALQCLAVARHFARRPVVGLLPAGRARRWPNSPTNGPPRALGARAYVRAPYKHNRYTWEGPNKTFSCISVRGMVRRSLQSALRLSLQSALCIRKYWDYLCVLAYSSALPLPPSPLHSRHTLVA